MARTRRPLTEGFVPPWMKGKCSSVVYWTKWRAVAAFPDVMAQTCRSPIVPCPQWQLGSGCKPIWFSCCLDGGFSLSWIWTDPPELPTNDCSQSKLSPTWSLPLDVLHQQTLSYLLRQGPSGRSWGGDAGARDWFHWTVVVPSTEKSYVRHSEVNQT